MSMLDLRIGYIAGLEKAARNIEAHARKNAQHADELYTIASNLRMLRFHRSTELLITWPTHGEIAEDE